MESVSRNSEKINELLEFINEALKTYNSTADETQDEKLRDFCLLKALERQQFADDLRSILEDRKDSQIQSGTVSGDLFRAWIELKSTFSEESDESMIACILYGEEWTINAYKKVINSAELTEKEKSILNEHLILLNKTYSEVKDMELVHHHH